MSDAPDQDTQPMQLPAILDVRAAAPLAAELSGRRGQDVVLDASGVRRLGGQCLQVLLAARACWETEGVRFGVWAPSNDFTDALTLLGASSLIASQQA